MLRELLTGLGLSRYRFDDDEAIAAGLLSADRHIADASVRAILQIIEQAPDNSFLLHHLPHAKLLMNELARRDVRVIALLRSPFDVIVSQAHHLLERPQPDPPADLSLHAMQHWICAGGDDGAPAAPLAKRNFSIMHGWVDDTRTLVLRFEEIIGPRGGGQFSDQLASGLKLREFLGIEADTAEVARALIASFRSNIAIFRRGQIGSWKDEMAPNTAEQVRLGYGKMLEQWGYGPEGELLRPLKHPANMAEEMNHAIAALIDDNVHLRAKMRRLIADHAPEANSG